MDFLQKNKMLLLLAVVLGGFLLFAWKTDFSLVKYINSGYVPGQQQPPQQPPNAKPDPYIPGQQAQPKTSESGWRRQFEEERTK